MHRFVGQVIIYSFIIIHLNPVLPSYAGVFVC